MYEEIGGRGEEEERSGNIIRFVIVSHHRILTYTTYYDLSHLLLPLLLPRRSTPHLDMVSASSTDEISSNSQRFVSSSLRLLVSWCLLSNVSTYHPYVRISNGTILNSYYQSFIQI